jgi:hypothetical protein
MLLGRAVLLALIAQNAVGPSPGAPPARARLDVHGAAECVSRTDLAARVAARSPRIQFADDAEIAAEVVVTSARPGNVVAELTLGAARAEASPRRVVGRSCADAADAIALIIAVTLDPTSSAGAPATVESTSGGPPVAGRPAASQPPPAPKPPATPVAPTPPATAAVVESSRPASVPARPTRRRFGATLAGQTIFGPAPEVMPGIAIYAMAALDRDGVWAPALFLGATRVWRSNISETDGSASFVLDAGSLDVCPVRFEWSRVLLRPCASALGGRLNASGGADTRKAASAARPFGMAGGAVTAGVGLTARLELSVRLGVGVTLLRDSYELGTTTFHRADRVTTAASLGVGGLWP